MLRFAADENFNNDILRGLRRLYPEIEIIRVQDTDLYEADDPAVLEWAVGQGLILLTHDVNTMTKYAYERVVIDLPIPGIFITATHAPVGQIIDELAIIMGASDTSEWQGKITFIPLR
ncbi:MAG: DUF5615 family PIN-like protein [Chloroflexota bacterium]